MAVLTITAVVGAVIVVLSRGSVARVPAAAGPAPRVTAPLSPRPSPTPSARPLHDIVGLGDSVPAGAACSCTSYIDLVAHQIGRDQRIRTVAHNLAVPGQTTAGLLQQLSQRDTVEVLRRADVVILTIGANDLEAKPVGGGCATLKPSCFTAEAAAVDVNLDRILRRIRGLTDPETEVVVTGYWNVFLDGAVAKSLGADYVRNSAVLTRAVDDSARSAATAWGAAYADLYAAFTRDGDRDDTALLASDGDHPNAAGHRVIAAAVMTALQSEGCRC
jgi:lysophospholipase L1-like esterase